MRIVLVIFFSILFSFGIRAQQYTNYTQYTLNRFALNPAMAGLKRCAETTFGNRRQWVGFENAPNVSFASFNTRINREDKYPKNFHGVGAHIVSERHGFSSVTYVKLAYAYHIKLWVNYHLSVGVFAGIQRHSFSYDLVRLPNKSIDPAINQEVSNDEVYPEVSPGGFIYNRNFYAGLSMIQGYPAQTGDLGTSQNRLTSHYFLSGGYRFRGLNRLDFIPSFMLSFSPFVSPTFDATLTADYKQRMSVALGSKYLNSGYVTVQFRIARKIYLGYSYEYALNEINNVAPSSHEIVINFTNCTVDTKHVKFVCPAYQ